MMQDFNLAELYGQATSAFNQQAKRNAERFDGKEFMFQLLWDEVEESLKSQIVTSS